MSKNYIIKEDLSVRLNAAAANGDEVAKFIVGELKKKDRNDIFNGNANYFRCSIIMNSDEKTINKINVSYSSLNKKNKASAERLKLDPSAVYMENNSSTANLASFVRMFKNVTQDLLKDKAIDEFNEAMKVGSPLIATISDSIYDFKRAYNHSNYAPFRGGDDCNDTLNHSCMRHNNINENVASFYCNIAKCKIMTVCDVMQQVVGRAIIWPDITMQFTGLNHSVVDIDHISLISRLYYTSVGVRDFMIREAKKSGINLRLKKQALDCRSDFIELNPIENPAIQQYRGVSGFIGCDCIYSLLHPSYKHKIGGIPYVDVYDEIVRSNEDGNFYIASSAPKDFCFFAGVHNTSCYTSMNQHICPVCGETFTRTHRDMYMCDNCINKHATRTSFGTNMTFKAVNVPGYGMVPSVCTYRGKLTKNAANANMLRQLENRN